MYVELESRVDGVKEKESSNSSEQSHDQGSRQRRFHSLLHLPSGPYPAPPRPVFDY